MGGKIPSDYLLSNNFSTNSQSLSDLRTCSICLDVVNSDPFVQVHSALALGHIFHRNCLIQWQNETKRQAIQREDDFVFSCPLCRRSITPIPSSAPSSRPTSRDGNRQNQDIAERIASDVDALRSSRTITPTEIFETRTPLGTRTFVMRFN